MEHITKSKTLVILDAGHGINTPGKRSPKWKDGTQLFEWEFNRTIVDKLFGYLRAANISCIKLVTEDIDISLENRRLRINSLFKKYKKDYYIYVVSVHGNAAENSNANGIEVFTCKKQDDSDLIAELFLKELKELNWKMRYDVSDGDLDKEGNFGILKVECPAILTENGFYTNEEECKKMLDFYWQNQIVLAHMRAIIKIEYGEINLLRLKIYGT